jgi:hypothetical protein
MVVILYTVCICMVYMYTVQYTVHNFILLFYIVLQKKLNYQNKPGFSDPIVLEAQIHAISRGFSSCVPGVSFSCRIFTVLVPKPLVFTPGPKLSALEIKIKILFGDNMR